MAINHKPTSKRLAHVQVCGNFSLSRYRNRRKLHAFVCILRESRHPAHIAGFFFCLRSTIKISRKVSVTSSLLFVVHSCAICCCIVGRCGHWFTWLPDESARTAYLPFFKPARGYRCCPHALLRSELLMHSAIHVHGVGCNIEECLLQGMPPEEMT